MLVEDLIRIMPMSEKVDIITAGEHIYRGLTYSIPEHLLDYEVSTIWDYFSDDCIYISIY